MADTSELKRNLWAHMRKSPFVMVGLAEAGAHSEPLTAQLDEDQVDTLWFFIGRDNRLARGGRAAVQFVSKGHDFFASLSGTARIDQDRAMIDELWSRPIEAWFPGGKDDPNLALLRFDIAEAELWEADMSLPAKVKMLFGGRIRAEEEGSHATVDSTAG